MLHALLITGADLRLRTKQAEAIAKTSLINSPDILVLQADPSLTIHQVRQATKFLSRQTYQADKKILFLPEAEKLTLPAQHCLLKTLEEPPAHSLIILTAPHPHLLLPTINSRCQVIKLLDQIKLSPQQLKHQKQLFTQISTASLGQRIDLAQQHGPSKPAALQFCRQQLTWINQLSNKQKPAYSQLLNCLSLAINQLNANLHPRLCLENLFFHYPKP